jgi:hypothetical protein
MPPQMKRRGGIGVAFVITVAGGALAVGCESAPCPASPPVRGEACEPPAGGQCVWTSPCPPYKPARTSARCESGRWEVSYAVLCNPPSLGEDAGGTRADATDALPDLGR